ncbi:MAG: glycosyltransferase [Bacteroidia bacterium]|nr:glycosyltransferase [Bacteroidia bacterium]
MAVLILWIVIYILLYTSAFSSQKTTVFNAPASVIIAAKNESLYLSAHLPSILAQDYHNFEVIVVVNQTQDNTLEQLSALQKQYPHLRWMEIVDIPSHLSPKKYAITQAIRTAKHDYLVFTDADCFPASNKWLQNILAPFSNAKIDLVLGYSPYILKNTLLNALIQYETTFTAIQYLGLARVGLPYMGVGRNMAYKKSLFYRYTFEKHQHIYSGDDDLFVNQAAKPSNTAIQTHPLAWVYSVPHTRWQKWYKQKARHISAGRYYQLQDLLVLGFLAIINVILPFLPLVYFLKTKNFHIFALSFLCMYLTIKFIYTRLNIKVKLIHLLLSPFLYSLYQITFTIKGIFSKHKTSW